MVDGTVRLFASRTGRNCRTRSERQDDELTPIRQTNQLPSRTSRTPCTSYTHEVKDIYSPSCRLEITTGIQEGKHWMFQSFIGRAGICLYSRVRSMRCVRCGLCTPCLWTRLGLISSLVALKLGVASGSCGIAELHHCRTARGSFRRLDIDLDFVHIDNEKYNEIGLEVEIRARFMSIFISISIFMTEGHQRRATGIPTSKV